MRDFHFTNTMKKAIILFSALVALSACNKTPQQTETSSQDSVQVTDTVAVDSTIVEQKDSFKIDYPVDSLLSFNSEKELKKTFGKYAKSSVGQLPEGMGEYSNTILFPGTRNEVEFTWTDRNEKAGLESIRLSGKNSDWKTKEGVHIGSSLKELQKLNGAPFIFYGLAWDYSGAIEWTDGALGERMIDGFLEYPNGDLPKEFNSLIGDKEINSDDPVALKANLKLGKLILHKVY